MNKEISPHPNVESAIARLIEDGNKLHLKAAEQEGILASALIAASGLGIKAGTTPGMFEITCLIVTVALAVGQYLGLGTWDLMVGKKWIEEREPPKNRTIWLPTIGLIVQTIAFLGGLVLFLLRLFH